MDKKEKSLNDAAKYLAKMFNVPEKEAREIMIDMLNSPIPINKKAKEIPTNDYDMRFLRNLGIRWS